MAESQTSAPNSNESVLVPEDWKYHPSNCVGTWGAWFQGNKTDPPLRHIEINAIQHKISQNKLRTTAKVVQKLIAATGFTEDMLENLDKEAFADTFHMAFEKLYPSKDPKMNIITLADEEPDSTSHITCFELWMKWFGAKPKPWRVLSVKQMPSELQQEHIGNSKFIAKLTEVALNLGLVETKSAVAKLSDAPRKALFSLAVQAFVAQCGPNCCLTPESLCTKAKPFLHVTLDPTFRLGDKPIFPFLPLRAMWRRWFFGHDNPTHTIPYRKIYEWHEDSADWVDKTRRGIDTFIQVALDNRIVQSIKALEAIQLEDELMKVFDKTFPLFRDQFVGKELSAIHPRMFSYSLVHRPSRSFWKLHPEFDGESKKAKKPRKKVSTLPPAAFRDTEKSTTCGKK
ncbi:unnamed protein product [Aphanomyces euteiches]|uniref:Uncharacterized protein n=1 Tax=Aphanomyces euteiches TaxID=100861 RepID=A0A6G0WVV8_9STRA|nr:hypothetical protein Ae201684_011234 [Aphanomyces euteiches]KAH9058478.1 hypothetical protein Ae201684P_005821 [Aphanomyces euteiches]KAH9145649.1 hypothetical protein AeRB84_010460 [Aphanomyces euteiches]